MNFKKIDLLKNMWNEIPKQVQFFLLRCLIIFLVWKISYHLYLKPNRLIDKPLTIIVSKNTLWVLEKIYPTSIFTIVENRPVKEIDNFVVTIIKDNKKVLGIADPCNALELMILYTGFIFSMPNGWKKMLTFIVIGTVAIYICNIIRCSFIGYLNIQRSWTIEIVHHYVFKLIMYFLIFICWILYMKKGKIYD